MRAISKTMLLGFCSAAAMAAGLTAHAQVASQPATEPQAAAPQSDIIVV